MGVTISIGCTGLAILIHAFYNNLDKQIPIYINLFSIPILCGVIPLTIFVGVFFFKQTKLISRGITTKQEVAIFRSGSTNYNNPMTNEEAFKNIIKFLIKPQPESLITSN